MVWASTQNEDMFTIATLTMSHPPPPLQCRPLHNHLKSSLSHSSSSSSRKLPTLFLLSRRPPPHLFHPPSCQSCPLLLTLRLLISSILQLIVHTCPFERASNTVMETALCPCCHLATCASKDGSIHPLNLQPPLFQRRRHHRLPHRRQSAPD